MRQALALAAVLAALPAAAAEHEASTLSAWSTAHPSCSALGCSDLVVEHAWGFQACSDKVAAVEWVVLDGFLQQSWGSRVLNGPPGAPGSVGSCYGESETGWFLVVDCVAVQVTMVPLGEAPQHREAYACHPFHP